mmetsp:Transcript_22692/g.63318  ORF Transcript_22692/g.63318 Transcript_22692/m.63318 type:complete len:206 (+) Transcript_22692:480-1097(+)
MPRGETSAASTARTTTPTLPMTHFQALPLHYEVLKANLRVNFVDRHVQLFPYAVGDAAGGVLSIALDPHNLGASSAVNCENTSHVSAPVTTLDDIYAALPSEMRRVLVMKIDIEGWEGRALYGGVQFLSESPPCYLRIELMQKWLSLARTPLKQLLAYLADMGYDTEGFRRVNFLDHDYIFRQVDLATCIEARIAAAGNGAQNLA